MKNKKDNIYVYIWEKYNTIYIGRTINPKSRHYQHKKILLKLLINLVKKIILSILK